MKKCSRCKGEKEPTDFSKNKSTTDGLGTVCKICAKITAKEWREKNRFDGRVVAQKNCVGCNNTKSADKFYNDASRQDGLSTQCKECIRIYRVKNRDAILTNQRARNKRAAEKEKVHVTGRVCAQCKTYKSSDSFWKSRHTIDGLYSCCIECKKALESTSKRQAKRYQNQKSWVNENRERVRGLWNEWDRNRRKSDVSYRLRRNVMHAIVASVRNYSFNAKLERLKTSIFEHLNYTTDDLKRHIEAQWEPWMNWDNYGKYDAAKQTWQIDHIIAQSLLPFESFDDENFKKLWALGNLRPLETVANIRKGNGVV